MMNHDGEEGLGVRELIPDWKSFVKAGHAIFTVENETTGGRLTYRVNKCDDEGKELWFVSVLSGCDNDSDYSYVGTIFGREFRLTRRSRVSEDAPSYKVFNWLYRYVESDAPLPATVHVFHEGRCGRCGRRLTVPESIRQGFGPECIQFVGGGHGN